MKKAPFSFFSFFAPALLAACSGAQPDAPELGTDEPTRTSEPEASPGVPQQAPEARELHVADGAARRTTNGSRALCCGSRRTLVEGIDSAENMLFTSDGRLLVTGNDGIHEVRLDDAGAPEGVLLQAADACPFLGIAEVRGMIYVNCADLSGDSSVYAGALADGPSFRRILALPGVLLSNGLAADASGRLYIAHTFDGEISRITLDETDPFLVARHETWLSDTGLGTNGVKVLDSAVYWTDFGSIKRAVIQADGSAGPPEEFVVFGTLFFDDLYVDTGVILAADYLLGALRAYDLQGAELQPTPLGTFEGPSSVLPAEGRLGLGARDLLVTEKDANRLAVYSVR